MKGFAKLESVSMDKIRALKSQRRQQWQINLKIKINSRYIRGFFLRKR